jgi:hypothetical protein
MDAQITDAELSRFLQRTEQAASAYMCGDMERYLALTQRARGFTLGAHLASTNSERRPFGRLPACSKAVRPGWNTSRRTHGRTRWRS